MAIQIRTDHKSIEWMSTYTDVHNLSLMAADHRLGGLENQLVVRIRRAFTAHA
jgi:hypothetical protein